MSEVFRIRITDDIGDPTRSVLQAMITKDRMDFGLSVETVKPGMEPMKLQLSNKFLQELADKLFEAGFAPRGLKPPKPSDSSDSFLAGKVEAMQEHLADLRRLAFGEPKGPDQPQTPGGEY